jgi:Tfp pilus assembly protein PilX
VDIERGSTELRETAEAAARTAGEQVAQVGATAAESGERFRNAGMTVAREGAKMGRAMAEDGAEISASWSTWWPEQIQDSWRASFALARCRTLGDVAEVQAEFFRSSLERFSRCLRASLPFVVPTDFSIRQ